MPHLNEPNAVLAFSKCFHDAVDAVTRKAEDYVDAPASEGVDEDISAAVLSMNVGQGTASVLPSSR